MSEENLTDKGFCGLFIDNATTDEQTAYNLGLCHMLQVAEDAHKEWNTRQSADVEGAIELIDININSLALTEDRFPIIFGTECTKILTAIKNKLEGK